MLVAGRQATARAVRSRRVRSPGRAGEWAGREGERARGREREVDRATTYETERTDFGSERGNGSHLSSSGSHIDDSDGVGVEFRRHVGNDLGSAGGSEGVRRGASVATSSKGGSGGRRMSVAREVRCRCGRAVAPKPPRRPRRGDGGRRRRRPRALLAHTCARVADRRGRNHALIQRQPFRVSPTTVTQPAHPPLKISFPRRRHRLLGSDGLSPARRSAHRDRQPALFHISR